MAGEYSRESDQQFIRILLATNHDLRKKNALLEKEVESLKQILSDMASKPSSPPTAPKAEAPSAQPPASPGSYDRVPVPKHDITPTKVRGKARKNLEGHTCDQCVGFYEAAGLGDKTVQKCTRHRGQKRPATPPGWWAPGWESPTKTPKKFIPEEIRPRKTTKDSDCKVM